jgi:hypothetical protein
MKYNTVNREYNTEYNYKYVTRNISPKTKQFQKQNKDYNAKIKYETHPLR